MVDLEPAEHSRKHAGLVVAIPIHISVVVIGVVVPVTVIGVALITTIVIVVPAIIPAVIPVVMMAMCFCWLDGCTECSGASQCHH